MDVRRVFSTWWKYRSFRRCVWLLCGAAGAVIPLKIFFSYFRKLMPYLPPCPSVYFLKLHCPGCGSVRAMYCLFHGNVRGIFANNIMLLPSLFLVIMLFIKPDFCRHYKFFAAYTAVLIVFGILRNLPWYPFSLLAPAGI